MNLNAPQRAVLRLTPEEGRLVQRLMDYRADLTKHTTQCLKVVDKNSRMVPMVLNKAQLLVHARLEAQLREHGMVRAMVLKGRQQGISTYVGARFYSKTRLWKYRSAKVMAHVQDSTDALFSIVRTYYENDPLRLKADTSNAKEYGFSNGSSYSVATAGGSGEQGRGDKASLVHLSEVAFYANPEKNYAAFVNSVPPVAGTEVIAESTANGVGNEFHRRWLRAEASDKADEDTGIVFVPIFVPWWLSDEYRMPAPGSFVLSGEAEGPGLPSERDIAEMYGLDMTQMAWRRYQRDEVLGSVEKFMQEYPCTATEAFQSSGENPFIQPVYLARARRRPGIPAYGPKILGIDPSGGRDRFVIAFRQGFVLHWYRWRKGLEPEEFVHWVASVVEEVRPDRVNVDYSGGWGSGLIAGIRLHYPHMADLFFSVDFGSKSQAKAIRPHKPGPKNRRAEMADRFRTWIMQAEGVRIPDDDELSNDSAAVTEKFQSQITDIQLESKQEIKKKLGRSPDIFDGVILTFAAPDTTIETPLTVSTPTGNDVFAQAVAKPAPVAPAPAPVRDDWSRGFGRFDSGGGWM